MKRNGKEWDTRESSAWLHTLGLESLQSVTVLLSDVCGSSYRVAESSLPAFVDTSTCFLNIC